MLPRFGNTITNVESLIFCNTLFAFKKLATTGALVVELSWQNKTNIRTALICNSIKFPN